MVQACTIDGLIPCWNYIHKAYKGSQNGIVLFEAASLSVVWAINIGCSLWNWWLFLMKLVKLIRLQTDYQLVIIVRMSMSTLGQRLLPHRLPTTPILRCLNPFLAPEFSSLLIIMSSLHQVMCLPRLHRSVGILLRRWFISCQFFVLHAQPSSIYFSLNLN